MAEDNPADVELLRIALRSIPDQITLDVVRDGAEAMEFLQKQGKYADSPSPDLVIVDLNMPMVDGYAFLAMRAQKPAVRCIPVLVFSTSSEPREVNRAYAGGANAYVTKPMGFSQYAQIMACVSRFWLHTCSLPEH